MNECRPGFCRISERDTEIAHLKTALSDADRLWKEINTGQADRLDQQHTEMERLRVERDGWIKFHANRQAEVEQACAELVRIRCEKEALVETLKLAFQWMKYPLKPPSQSELEIVDAAIRSATCQADFSPCTFPTCACSATESNGEPT